MGIPSTAAIAAAAVAAVVAAVAAAVAAAVVSAVAVAFGPSSGSRLVAVGVFIDAALIAAEAASNKHDQLMQGRREDILPDDSQQ